MSEQELVAEQGAVVETENGSLLDQILQQTNMKAGDESYDVASKGVQAFIAEILTSSEKTERVQKQLVDDMIAEIDEKLSLQLDQILHNEKVQKLESAWRGLKFVEIGRAHV